MNAFRLTSLSAAIVFSTLLFTGTPAFANNNNNNGSECLPGIVDAFRENPVVYGRLYAALAADQRRLRLLLDEVRDQVTYAALLNNADALAASISDGRVLVTLPDGTVVLDTARPNDPSNTLPVGNSYRHFVEKTVNENHNSRVAIFAAQQYPCGVGLEQKVSTTTNSSETYVAQRLGRHLNSSGTARLSTTR